MDAHFAASFARCVRFAVLAIVAALVLSWPWSDARAQEPGVSWHWRAPGGARVIRWNGSDADVRASARTVDPAVPSTLAVGELLVLPASAGSRMRFEGSGVEVGLGSGQGSLPDVITWTELDDARELRLPGWSSARFVVVRVSVPGEVRVRVAARDRDALRWHRFDREIGQWLEGVRRGPLQAPSPEAQSTVRWLLAADSLLAASPGDPAGDPSKDPAADPAAEARAAWLTQRWLAESLRHRPLVAPYFKGHPVVWEGGRAGVGAPGAVVWREAVQGERLGVAAAGLDVVRMVVETRSDERVHLQVLEGDFPIREIVLAKRGGGAGISVAGVQPALRRLTLRAVVPPDNPRVTLSVLEGRIWVNGRAYAQRTDLFDAFARRRDRRRQLERARSGDDPLLGALATLDAERSVEARDALARLSAGSDSGAMVAAAEVLAAREPARTVQRTLERLAAQHPGDGRWVPLRRHVLERWLDVRGTVEPGLRTPAAAGVEAGFDSAHPEDRATDAALRTLLWPPVFGTSRNPETAYEAEVQSERSGSVAALRLARRLWLREGRWTSLDVEPDAPGELTWHQPPPPVEGSDCPLRSPGGAVRWRLLEGSATIPFEAPEGRHAKMLLRAADDDPRTEHEVLISGTPVTVHSLAGLATRVAVAPGTHRLEVRGEGPLLARIPSSGQAPCSALRQPIRWLWTTPSARFLTTPEPTPTVFRVMLRPDTLPAEGTQVVQARVGGRRLEAWFRAPASGALEALLPAGSTDLEVSASGPVLVRASARLRLSPGRAWAGSGVAPAEVVRVSSPSGETTPEEHRLAWLDEVHRATRALAAGARDADRDAVLRRRAEAVRRLGHWRLAVLDEELPEPDPRAVDPDSVVVYGTREPVVPLGWTPRVPPLEAPTSLEPLRQARAARAIRAPSDRILQLLGDARDSDAADALLFALEAEQVGRLVDAANATERIAAAHGAAAAYEHAATLWADAAVATGDESLSMRALLAARRAEAAGGAAVGALARLREAIRWVTPGHLGARGNVVLEHFEEAEERPFGERVYRAYLGAPEQAALFFQDRQLELRIDRTEPAPLALEGRCLSLSGPGGRCSLEVRFDGSRRRCEDSVSEGGLWRCSLGELVGGHRVEVRLPEEGESVAWVALRGEAGADERARSLSRWSLVDEERPTQLLVAGPTVVHVRARAAGTGRASGAEPPRLLVRATPTGRGRPGRGGDETFLTLNAEVDPTSHLVGAPQGSSVARESEVFVTISEVGPHRIEMSLRGGAALLQVRAAVASGLPRARELDEEHEEGAAPLASGSTPQGPPRRPGVVQEPPARGWGTFRAYAAAYDTELTETDRDPRARYLEIGVGVQRALVPDRIWLGAFAFTRPRFGQDSQGVDLNLDVGSRGVLPGVFVRGHWVQQPFEEGAARGGYASLGVLWSVPLADTLSLVPWTSATLRRVGEVGRLRDDVDPSVFTSYAEDHPWTPTAGLRLDHRPFLDTVLRLGASTRANTSLASLDRTDLRGTLHTLPGDGFWPWLSFDAVLSHRPLDEHRQQAFWRMTLEPRVTFWSWIGGSHRITLTSAFTYLRDFPETSRSGNISTALLVGYDFTAQRGLDDLPPRERLFRDRLEEGSGLPRVPRPTPAPGWEVTP